MTVQDRPALPVGPYVGRFVGASHQDTSGPGWKPAIGRDGQALPPGLIWSFEIIEGPHAGAIADRMTGKVPTPASTCGVLLSALLERPISVGDEIDTDVLIGTIWRFHIEKKERGQGTTVSTRGLVRARDLEPRVGVVRPPLTVASLPAPPPDDDETAAAGELPDEPRWWIKRGKGMAAEAVTYVELLEFVRAGADPHKDKCCPVGQSKWVKIIDAVPEASQVKPIV